MLRNALPLRITRGWSLRDVRTYVFEIACLFLVSRLAFLNLNKAEFTDGYLILQWSFANPNRWHPLYPLLIKAFAAFMDSIVAGRLVSVIAGFLTMIPLSQIAARLYSNRTALITCLLFTVSSLNFWVDSHVLTESLFVFISLVAIRFYLPASDPVRKSSSDFFLFTLFAVLAFLTRPEGYFFLPLWIHAAIVNFRDGRIREVILSVPLFIPAAGYMLWMHVMASSEMYEKGLSNSLHSVILPDVMQRLIGYAEIYPYVVFYPVFILAVLHFFSSAHPKGNWPRLLVYIHIIFFLMLGIHTAWSSRFLILPATLILIEAAAMLDLIRQKWTTFNWRMLLATVAGGSAIFSVLCLFGQRDTFSDFKNAGVQLSYERNAGRIYSDEFLKTFFYAERPILSYSRSKAFEANDLIVLHSFHTELPAEWNYLRARYDIECLSTARSEILPLLASLPLTKNYLTNNPVASLERFRVQKFQTVILHVRSQRNALR